MPVTHLSTVPRGHGARRTSILSTRWGWPEGGRGGPRAGDAPRDLRRASRARASTSEDARETRRGVSGGRSGTRVEELPLPEGDSGLPFIGAALDLIVTAKHVLVAKHVKKNGYISRASLLGNEAIIVAGRDHLNKILVQQQGLFTQGYFKTLANLVGPNSMLLLDGEEHMTLRRLIGPAFSRKDVYSYVPKIARLAEEHCSDWADRGSIKFLSEVRHYAISVITEAALGIEFPVGSWTKQDVLDLFRTWVSGILSFGINLQSTKFGRAMEARRRLLEMVDEIIETLREDPNGRGGLHAMLFARDEQGNSLRREQLQDSIMSLLFAGYDATATTMSTSVLELAKNPKVWGRLKAEQDEVVALHGPEFTEHAIEAMTYTEAVVRESMRVLPPADGSFKVATQTFELNGYRIPKGSTVFPATGATAKHFDHRWPLDAEFCPERFLSGAGLDPLPDLAFGLGAHSCLGKFLSVVENKVLLATLARGYDFAVLDTDPRIVNAPIPQPVDGVPMVVRRRW